MRKLGIFLSLSLTFCACVVQAADYGYVRVLVVQQRLDHPWPVKLFANGTPLGPGFSHSETGMSSVTLQVGHLNPRGPTTQLKAQYGDLQSHGCQFQFKIEFSYSGDFSRDLIPLGTYTAPNDEVHSLIPIGLSCAGKVGEICSNDPGIQRQIEKAKRDKAVIEYNQWKREYDRKIQMRMAKNNSLGAVESSGVLANVSTPAQIEELKIEDVNSEVTQNESKDLPYDAETENYGKDYVDSLVGSVLAQERAISMEQREQLAARLYGTVIGAPLGAWVEADAVFEQVIQMNAETVQMLRNEAADAGGGEDSFKNLQADLLKDAIWFQKSIVHGGAVKEAAALGVRFGMGNAIDACELVTQRELCMPNGRQLSNGEVIAAGVGIFIGSHVIWSALVSKLGHATERLVLKFVEDINEASKTGRWSNVFEAGLPVTTLAKPEAAELASAFKKSKGIPEDWMVKIADRKERAQGIIFHSSDNVHNNVRIMPGKPSSPYPVSQRPYVVWRRDGKILDQYGNFSGDPNLTHIPMDIFYYNKQR